ncbi:MAG: hypothetical protein JWM12_1292 [Ilumatobacteraceae bacterium]|nr:hypothetical protein [Ilumatobacteraceae bacterium]
MRASWVPAALVTLCVVAACSSGSDGLISGPTSPSSGSTARRIPAVAATRGTADPSGATTPSDATDASAASVPTPSDGASVSDPTASDPSASDPSASAGPPDDESPAGPATRTAVVGGATCGLSEPAFCETFDVPHNGGTRTGDLDPVLWGVSRLADANPGQAANNIVSAHLDGCGAQGATPPPQDVRICDGQMVEAVNDGGGVANLDTYPKQPFHFAGRTGTVVFDVSADSQGSHAAWPEFLITDDPIPGARRSISFQPPPHAQNEIGFSIDAGCNGQDATTVVGVIFLTVDGVYSELQNSRPNCIAKGSRTAMNHFEVQLSQDHIEVWGTDAGSTTLKQLAVEDIALAPTFKQGLVWLNDVHYNARKAVEPCACGTQFDHTFAWDNLGFDGPKTYRDLGYDVADAHAKTSNRSIQGDAQIRQGYDIGKDPTTFTLTGVRWDQTPTKAKVVLNVYSFERTPTSVRLNGHDVVVSDWRPTDSAYAWRSLSIEVPVADVVQGDNKLTLTSDSESTIIANVSLILVAAAPVP